MSRALLMKRFTQHGHWNGWFYDETWRTNIEIIWPVSGRQVSAYLNREHRAAYKVNDDFGAKCIELMDPEGRETNVICLRWWAAKPRPAHYAMLTHECFHAVEHVLSARGVALKKDSTEAYAYFMEGVVRRCLILLDTRRRVES